MKTIKIFLVDDDQLYLDALSYVLAEKTPNYSAEIQTFTTGEACLEHMKENPTVVVLDYYMNSSVKEAMNGIAVLKKIKIKHPNVKVIMLSAQDSINIASEMLEHGAFDYVGKNESAFVRIKNIIANISKTSDVLAKVNKEVSLYKKVNIIAIVIIVLLFIISTIYSRLSD